MKQKTMKNLVQSMHFSRSSKGNSVIEFTQWGPDKHHHDSFFTSRDYQYTVD